MGNIDEMEGVMQGFRVETTVMSMSANITKRDSTTSESIDPVRNTNSLNLPQITSNVLA